MSRPSPYRPGCASEPPLDDSATYRDGNDEPLPPGITAAMEAARVAIVALVDALEAEGLDSSAEYHRDHLRFGWGEGGGSVELNTEWDELCVARRDAPRERVA